MEVREEKRRKVRSDKKKEVQPIVPLSVYETIARLSYITNQPMKNIGEELCIKGLYNIQVIDYLSSIFQRDFKFNEYTFKIGNIDPSHKRTNQIQGDKKTLAIRFKQEDYPRLANFAHALDKTISSATSLLLQAALKQPKLLNEYIETFIDRELTPAKKKELKKVVRFINRNNPYDDEVSLLSIINLIIEDVLMSDTTLNIKQGIHDFINHLLED